MGDLSPSFKTQRGGIEMSIATQKQLVLIHFKKRKSITSWEAIQSYGITRLAAVICDLKDDGFTISRVMEYGDGKRWARYTLLNGRK
jgi:hypothetical protein